MDPDIIRKGSRMPMSKEDFSKIHTREYANSRVEVEKGKQKEVSAKVGLIR